MICDVHAHYTPKNFSAFMGDRFASPTHLPVKRGMAPPVGGAPGVEDHEPAVAVVDQGNVAVSEHDDACGGELAAQSVQPAGSSAGVVDDANARAVGIELEFTWKLGAYVRVVNIAVDGDHRRADLADPSERV